MVDRSRKSTWGPALWLYMHTAAEFCDDAGAFYVFLGSLTGTLPCPECRRHLLEYTSKHPPAQVVVDAKTASAYVHDLHNHVNILTKKPQIPLPQSTPKPPPAQRHWGGSTGRTPAPAFGRPMMPPQVIASGRAPPRAPRTPVAPRLRRHG